LGNSKSLNAHESFVRQQCFIDIKISCHFVVLLIAHFRDRYLHLPVLLYLTGSDSYEIFFSKVRGCRVWKGLMTFMNCSVVLIC
jgi:hypothetical protein